MTTGVVIFFFRRRELREREREREEQETPAIFQIFSLHLEVRMISLSLTPLSLTIP